jgi:hypothetical protein
VRLNYKLPKQDVEGIVKCLPEAVEKMLLGLKHRLEALLEGTEGEERGKAFGGETQKLQGSEVAKGGQQKGYSMPRYFR